MYPRKATCSDWKIKPMSGLKIQLQVEEIFTREEYKYLSWGLIPRSMDDKWFIYLEDNWLYFHRSWTGYCIFQVRLEIFEDGHQIAEAWVNDDPEQCCDKFLLFWIDSLIRRNQEKEYCCSKVIIAIFICVYSQDILVSFKKRNQQNNFLFKINFICYLFSNYNFIHKSFDSDLYIFLEDDYFQLVE